MNKYLNILLFISVSLIFTNCNSEEDLTFEIVGDYIGAYGDNQLGTIDPYEITVERVDNNTISLVSITGNELERVEIEIQRINSGSISSLTDNNQQLIQTVTFVLATNETTINLSIDPTGDAQVFSGVKQ